jgi:hypothetical protein
MTNQAKDGVSLSVTINGRPVQTYHHEGRYFIESREGAEYCIEIKNDNWHRIEAVVAVDGLSVITGKTASKADSGYIVNGYGKVQIKGFRKSNEEVGAFKFTKKEQSYAAGKGGVDNVGIIAVAVYKEKQNPITFTTSTATWGGTTVGGIGNYPGQYTWPSGGSTCTVTDMNLYKSTGTNTSCNNVYFTNTCDSYETPRGVKSAQNGSLDMVKCCAVAEDSLSFKHGTTWGKKLEDKVVNVSFERCPTTQPTIFETYYNAKEILLEMGIKLIQEKQVTLPRGFPNDYATPPLGWQG